MQKNHWFSGNTYENLSKEIQKKNACILAKLFKPTKKINTIFELGCGTGNLTEELVKSNYINTIHALDISYDMINIAKEKSALKSVEFFCMPFPNFKI